MYMAFGNMHMLQGIKSSSMMAQVNQYFVQQQVIWDLAGSQRVAFKLNTEVRWKLIFETPRRQVIGGIY